MIKLSPWKDDMIPFRFKKTSFLFFFFFFLLQTIYKLDSCVHIPRAIGAFYHVCKWHNVQGVRSEMRRCTTHALYRSKLWQQYYCQQPQNANPDGSMCPGLGKQSFRLWLWSLVRFQVRATSCHPTSSKSAWKSTPKCTWICWRVWWSPGAIRWLSADPVCGSRTRRRPTSPKRPRLGFSVTTLYPSHWPPPPPTWTNSFGHTSRTSPTWSPTTSHNTKASLIAAIRRVVAELPPALVEKAWS